MGFHPSTIQVLAVSRDESRMDCEDDGSPKIWVVVSGWSYRRAILTHAQPFLDVIGQSDPYALESKVFMAKMDLSTPPPYEHESGERIEFPQLALARPMSEAYSALGIPEPEHNAKDLRFDPEYATGHLRAWLSDQRDLEEDFATSVVVEANSCWYRVNRVRWSNGWVLLGVEDTAPIYPRGESTEEDYVLHDLPEFGVRLSFSDAVELAEDHEADIARAEWPEGQYLRHDLASDQLVMHGLMELEPHSWIPTQLDVRLCDWIATKRAK